MKGLFGRLKDKLAGNRLAQGLARTREVLAENVHRVLTGRERVDEDALLALEEVLLGADVGVTATEKLLERLRDRLRRDGALDGDQAEAALQEDIAALLGRLEAADREPPPGEPLVVLLVGVNGTGKTTTLGKLAHLYRQAGKRVVVGAGDTFRAAAVEQLRVWAERAGVEVVAAQPGADPAAVVFDAVAAARARSADVVLIDTAGRLQTKVNLMEELRKITRVIAKQIPSAPHEVLLVLDATTGQNAISQARQFGEAAGVTGIVLTKVDGSAKGGVVVAIAEELGVPVRYLGLGEKLEDLERFEAGPFAAALFTRGPGTSEPGA